MIENEAVHEVCIRLEQVGHEAYLVGGCVRDLIRGKRPVDYDLATDASPEQLQQLFPESFKTGASFLVTRLVLQGEELEIATYRKDVYPAEGSSKPAEVTRVTTLHEDLQRRDFTINSIAMDIRGGIRDPFHGRDDLQMGLLRATHAFAFREDPVRILRGCKFVARDNLRIEPITWQQMKEAAPRLRHVSAERVQKELLQTLLGRYASHALHEWRTLELLPWILPELAQADPKHWELITTAIDLIPVEEMRPRAALLALTCSSTAIVARLGLPHKETPYIQFLAANYSLPFTADETSIGQWLDQLDIPGWTTFTPMLYELATLSLAAAQAMKRTGRGNQEALRTAAVKLKAVKRLQGNYPLGTSDLPFTGREFVERGLRGSEVGRALAEAVKWMRAHRNQDWESFWRMY